MNSYEAFFVDQQPGGQVPFLVFVANPKDIIRWAHADDIKRLPQKEVGDFNRL
ncbi:hypothetical protein V6582_20720 (plasmid) [Agrobacterium vitis]|uniref:hypothetical protein n=1 Tax=Agrobacterium vitis TaxID=373 RepID=UPI0012E7C214|nr:hypothetical protein [Agrobacterium vitis]MVA27280.1 hypothetical protein [Agrobacterium vitis]